VSEKERFEWVLTKLVLSMSAHKVSPENTNESLPKQLGRTDVTKAEVRHDKQ